MPVEPETKPGENKVWGTQFFLSEDPEDLKLISSILDSLRHEKTFKIDPKIADEEAEELWGH